MRNARNGSPFAVSGIRHGVRPESDGGQAQHCTPPWVLKVQNDEGLPRHAFTAAGARRVLLVSGREPKRRVIDPNLRAHSAVIHSEKRREFKPQVKLLFTFGARKPAIWIEERRSPARHIRQPWSRLRDWRPRPGRCRVHRLPRPPYGNTALHPLCLPPPALATGPAGRNVSLLQAPTPMRKMTPLPPVVRAWNFRQSIRPVHGKLRSVLPEFRPVRHEALALRAILRFTFDAMPDQKLTYGKEEACRLRHDILGPLNIASGFLELLSAELGGACGALAEEYLTRARDGVSRAIAIAVNIGAAPARSDESLDGGSLGTTAVNPVDGSTEGNS